MDGPALLRLGHRPDHDPPTPMITMLIFLITMDRSCDHDAPIWLITLGRHAQIGHSGVAEVPIWWPSRTRTLDPLIKESRRFVQHIHVVRHNSATHRPELPIERDSFARRRSQPQSSALVQQARARLGTGLSLATRPTFRVAARPSSTTIRYQPFFSGIRRPARPQSRSRHFAASAKDCESPLPKTAPRRTRHPRSFIPDLEQR